MSRVTKLYPDAAMKPTKLEVVAGWLELQPWFRGSVRQLRVVGNFRFEDPAGEVGMDSMLIESRGDVYYIPVTYRPVPLPGWAESMGEMHHSVLGHRYCYNAPTDPTFLTELRRVIAEGDTHSEMQDMEGVPLPVTVRVEGNGVASDGKVRLIRRLGTYFPGDAKLIARWRLDGVEREDVLATIH
ncbi:MAG: hypothetical protein GX596_10220 [Propionibacterium sp.]|nr:hypothetical protein [Propionibacterium sp.]